MGPGTRKTWLEASSMDRSLCYVCVHDTCTSTQILFRGESLFRWFKCCVTGLFVSVHFVSQAFGMEASRTGIDGVKNMLPWR